MKPPSRKARAMVIPGAIVFILLAVTFLITAHARLVASPWPMFHHDLSHTGLSSYDTTSNTGALKWIVITGTSITGPFSINTALSTCQVGTAVTAGAKCGFILVFAPTEATPQTGTLTIDNNSEPRSATIVNLRGSGKNPR